VQSERLFGALKGLGGTARWVVLPRESHGYSARESVRHVAWEMATWLDKHLKPRPRRERGGVSVSRHGTGRGSANR
jgi:dipeptidyl aminopeptidase/acylaminoacyl peptidase